MAPAVPPFTPPAQKQAVDVSRDLESAYGYTAFAWYAWIVSGFALLLLAPVLPVLGAGTWLFPDDVDPSGEDFWGARWFINMFWVTLALGGLLVARSAAPFRKWAIASFRWRIAPVAVVIGVYALAVGTNPQGALTLGFVSLLACLIVLATVARNRRFHMDSSSAGVFAVGLAFVAAAAMFFYPWAATKWDQAVVREIDRIHSARADVVNECAEVYPALKWDTGVVWTTTVGLGAAVPYGTCERVDIYQGENFIASVWSTPAIDEGLGLAAGTSASDATIVFAGTQSRDEPGQVMFAMTVLPAEVLWTRALQVPGVPQESEVWLGPDDASIYAATVASGDDTRVEKIDLRTGEEVWTARCPDGRSGKWARPNEESALPELECRGSEASPADARFAIAADGSLTEIPRD